MSSNYETYARLHSLRDALLVRYVPTRTVEQDIAFLMTYREALAFHAQLMRDYESRLRVAVAATGRVAEGEPYGYLPKISEISIPKPPKKPPFHGVWARIFGTRVVIISEDEGRI